MSSGWNAARRVAASERMHTRKPWLKSTGPRTVQGKARTCKNALKHGERSTVVITEHRQSCIICGNNAPSCNRYSCYCACAASRQK